MSEKHYTTPPESERVSAADLRRQIAENEIEEAKKKADKARAQDEIKRKAYEEFMDRRFTDEDRLQIRTKVMRAAEQGHLELEVLQFPSAYLEDHGRRINNGDSDWPVSLAGYAKSLYEAYQDLAEPQGYNLTARVLNYPDGMIGDIALVVNWKADDA